MRIGLIGLLLFLMACGSEQEDRVNTERTTRLDEFIRIPTDEEGKIDPESLPKLEFENTHFTYDTIQEGETIKHAFTFSNTGASSLLISSVKSSCGCTVANYPQEGIAPGEQAEIMATFNAKDKKGPQINEIIIYSNAYPSQHSLTLSGYVMPKK